LVAESFAIAGPRPQLLVGSAATYGASEQSEEDHAERRVEPDHGVGPRPHQVAGATTRVVPVDDPRVAFDRASDALLKLIDGDHRPVRTPVERVELDVWNAEPTR
jgi:hypothetical protein